jgi:hypothetical protein
VEEVNRQQPLRLGAEEGPPLRVHAAGCRPEPGCREDASDGAGADPVAQADQLTLDPAVPPGRILFGQAQHQVADLAADRRTAGPVRVGPVPLDQPAMPGQQRRRGDDPVCPQPARQDLGQRRQHRPVRPRQAGLADLAAQDRHLVTQHQQLRGLGVVVAGQ